MKDKFKQFFQENKILLLIILIELGLMLASKDGKPESKYGYGFMGVVCAYLGFTKRKEITLHTNQVIGILYLVTGVVVYLLNDLPGVLNIIFLHQVYGFNYNKKFLPFLANLGILYVFYSVCYFAWALILNIPFETVKY